ncbi:MAG TPA: PKD domain-containing protein [Pyrinomonadaceae bacterium]|nr:PKD domain-containing protein [Pyrinomonadaceae bacterium]
MQNAYGANDTNVREFEVQVSSATANASDFRSVLNGSLPNNPNPQEFVFPGGVVTARFIKLVIVGNYGSASYSNLSTFQPVSAGGLDSIISFLGAPNSALNQSPALAPNGGAIYNFSYSGGTTTADPMLGYGRGGWITTGTTNQFATIQLGGGKLYTLDGVKLATWYDSGYGRPTAVKDFEVWISATTPDANSFTKVLTATVDFNPRLQTFLFPGGPVQAKYVKYVPLNNWGGAANINTQILDVIAEGVAKVVAASGQLEYGTSPPEEAFDGNLNTFWYGPNGAGSDVWVKTSLEDETIHKVYGVRITPLNSYYYGFHGPKDFDIRVSTTTTDDSAFTTVYSGTLSGAVSNNAQEFLLPNSVDAKYVEFYWKNAYSDSLIAVSELEVLADSAHGSTVVGYSSSSDPSSQGPANALDIDTISPWVTANGQNTNQWLKLSLPNGDLWTIDHIALMPGFAYCGFSCIEFSVSPKDFELQVSTTDASDASFSTVLSGSLTNTATLQHFSFPAVQARYVRLLLKNNYGSGSISILGFYVYTPDHGSTDARFVDRSTDADGHIVSWAWNFGDGGTSTAQSPLHHYATAGSYAVTLTVTDDGGLTNSHQMTYTASASTLAPDFALSPVTAYEGEEYVRFTDTTQLLMQPYGRRVFDFGNGVSVTDLYQANYYPYQFPDSGTFNVTMTIGADNGLKSSVTKTITVLNLPPAVTVDTGKTVVWGEQWTNAPHMSDPSPIDSQTLHGLWDFGDGQNFSCNNCTNTSATATHAYTLPGLYNATLTVNDKDGGVGSATATYTVNKRPTALIFQSPPTLTNGAPLVIHATLTDTFANVALSGKPVQFILNGATFSALTGANGVAEVSVPLPAETRIDIITGTFAGDSLYLSCGGVGVPVTAGGAPPAGTLGNQGTNFWLMFPHDYFDGYGLALQRLYISSRVDTSGTVTIPGAGFNFTQNFTVQTNTIATVQLPFVQVYESDVIQDKGIHVTSQQPVTIYGLNQRVFTSDAFLGLPVNTLGTDHFVLTYSNMGFSPTSEVGMVATENATTVTITPSATSGSRAAGVPYNVTLNQGQTYLLQNTVPTTAGDLTGSRVSSNKPIAVFAGHAAATIPAEAGCCADHLVEQLPPTNVWGKRFATIPIATRTKGDFFRFIAAEDATAIYLNGNLAATLNRGQWVEKIIKEPTEIIATAPIMVAQYSTSVFYDPPTTGKADPFEMIIPPYSQFLNHYTISTPGTGFQINYANVVAPTASLGSITLDGTPISASSFAPIGVSGYSGAQIPITVGMHNLDGPASFGVFVYGFNQDEGYGYPGGMNMSASVQSVNVVVTPETSDRPINAQACVLATVTNQDQIPLGGKTITFTVTGANPSNSSATTDAAGQAQFCFTGTHLGSDLVTVAVGSASGTASVQWLTNVPNQAPVVNAGVDQTISLPAPVTLFGSVTDDGLPSNTLNISWSKVSGPGNIAFTTPSAAVTSATFNAAGVYVLRLTASDTNLSTSDDVQVTVNPTPTNQPPTANAGPDLSVAIKGNLIVNSGNEEPLVNGEIPGWIEEQGTTWTQGNSSIPGLPDAHRGQNFFYVGADGAQYAELRQDVDVSAFAASIATGTQQFEFQTWVRSLAEFPYPDTPRIIVEFRNAQNNGVLATMDSANGYAINNWYLTETLQAAPVGTGWMRVRLIATRTMGGLNDAYFDSVSLRPVGSAAVKLSGAVSDDGLPYGSSMSANWIAVSGPGAVTFTNPNAASSGASFTTPGTYVLRLTASDGQASTNDDVTITVYPINQPPTVSGGTNQTITLPETAPLNGIVNDDGLPHGSSLSTRWKKDQGPGIVTFANPDAASTTASFSTPGFYVLILTADDSEYSGSAVFYVNVNPSATNQPPTVNAGADQTIALPTNTVTLNGAAADDGLPSGSTLVVQWTQVSGPALASFTNPNSAVTTAQFSTAGTYVLRLNASDGQLTTSDDVTITVTGQNQPPTVNAGPDQATILSSGTQLNGSAGDDGLPTGSTLTTSWSKVSGPGTVTFMNANVTVTGAQFSATGTYVLRLTASDGALSSSDDVTIIVNDNVPPPTVQITAPADDSSITEPTIVSGSVSGGAWTLEYSLDSNDDQNSRVWTTFASGNGATSGTLGSLDPTMMMNGLFDIRLSATDSYGQTSRTKVSVIVERNLKVGNFTVSFTDLSIPVAGVPMEVTRTYDSRDKRIGDFGFGWTLGLHNIRVEKSSVIGLKWYETVSQEVFPNYCLEPVGSHAVTVTFPGGKVFKFQPNVAPHCQRNAPITSANISFTAMPGTVGKLEVIGSSDVQIDGSVPGPVNLIGFASGVDIFNSFVFKFTAEDGTAYIIDQRSGLQSLSDPNGNTLTIGAGGIVHSSGKSIVFNRDIVGRITSIVDPNGNSMTYGYDPNGDLVSYTDNENNTSTYTYDANHRLLTIHDPRGIQPIRNDYDPSGRLISHTDGFGKVITYLHDIPNRTETVTDRLGHPTVFEYDDRGNVLRKTDARGGVTSFTYDANDNVLTETNALGKTTTYTYDSNDHRTSITDPLNNVTQFTYNVLGKVLTTTDPLGHVTTNTYNTAGNLLTTEDALHNITSYTYSIFDGQQTAITDAAGNTTSYEYTGSFLSKQTDALGHETLYDSIPSGQVKTLTMHRTRSDNSVEDLVANYAYDLRNHLTKTTRPDGSIEKIEYNQIGKRSASVDALGHRITYDYDDMGRLIRRSYPDGTKEEFQYDAEGRQTKCIDRASHTTEYAYDELGRKTKTTYPDGTFTTSTYDAAGQVLSVSDERNNTTRYEYDAAGHRIKVTSALNEVTSFAYDQAGNEISRTDANGHTISYEYDQLNRRTKVKYPDTTFTTTTYDAIGRVIAKADQAGKTTQFEYDRLGQLVKVTDALGQVTSYTYDEAGQQISQTDARNQTTRYEADPMGRKTKRTLPLGVSEVFTYDPEGNPQSHTDFNGKTTTYVHDLMNRLVTKTPDPSLNQPPVLFTYNANGKRATMSDASGMTVYSYDARNRLSSKQTPAGTLNYTYDAAGNLQTTRSSHANGISVDYSFDSLNRLSSVKDNHIAGLNGGLTQYNYDSVGNLQSCQYPNGVATSYTYNALSRLTATAVGTPLAPLASYSYTLGAAGNRTAVTELSGRTVNYTYDDLYRLTSESITNDPHSVNGAVSYSYDPVGNRLNRNSTLPQVSSQVLTYDANNRLSSDSYDNNGNTTSADGNSYLYDFENHLTSENGGSVSYVYDGDGNRASKTAGGVTTNYLSDSNSPTGYPQVVEEIQGGSVIKSFGYGHSLISQQIVGGSLSFYQYDGHGSVRLLTNASGAITDTYDYDAFGNLINRTGSTPNDYLYNGEQFDANIGFYYLRARYLNPAAGRFLSMDSFEGDLADPISLHKYLYANADPVDKTDPSGKFGTFIDIAAAQDLNLSVIGIRVLQLILAVGIGIEIGRYLDRRWRMWTAGRLSPNFHTCMVAKDSQGGHNWTYDVGGLTAREYYDSKESPFTFFEGALEKSPALGDTALLIPVGRMMDWQLELWEIIMMGGTAGADEPFTTPYEYAFAFRNCTTWTIGAAATARIVSLIPS